MALLRPTVWTQQPQQACEIDWSNPITRGLYSANIPGIREFVTNSNVPITINATKGVGRVGQCLVQTTGGTVTNGVLVPKKLLSALTDLILSKYLTRYQYGCYFGASGTNEYIGSNLLDSRIEWRIHGASWNTNANIYTTDSATNMFGQDKCIVLSWNKDKNSGKGRVWVNGIELPNSIGSGHTGVCDRTQSSANTAFGINQGAGSSLYLSLHFERDLAESEIKSLSNNPWQIFQPLPQRIFVPVSAGDGGSSHNFVVASSVQDQNSSAGVVTQNQTITGASSVQTSASLSVAITQTQALVAASSTQNNASGTGAVTVGSVINLVAANSSQSQTSGTGAVSQVQVLTAANSIQNNDSASVSFLGEVVSSGGGKLRRKRVFVDGREYYLNPLEVVKLLNERANKQEDETAPQEKTEEPPVQIKDIPPQYVQQAIEYPVLNVVANITAGREFINRMNAELQRIESAIRQQQIEEDEEEWILLLAA